MQVTAGVPNAIELFSGCGGLSTGLLDAGVQVRCGVDNYAPTVRTFKFNHEFRGAYGIVADVREMNGNDLLAAAGIAAGNLQLLVGGPPCQPFSIIGKRKALDDHRGDLVFEFVRLVEETRPEAFIFENVANLASVAGGIVLEMLLEKMEAAGYTPVHRVLPAADYGVAQLRKRLIVVGVRGRGSVPFPPPASHGDLALLGQKPYRTARDVLDDLPDVGTVEGFEVPNHEPTHHSPRTLEAFARLQPGEREPKTHHDRLHPDRPAYTLRAGTGNFSPLRPVHYRYDRVITVRESARVQGFADTFIWPNDMPRLQQYRQVGNAVPPPFAEALAKCLAGILGWRLDPQATTGDPLLREPQPESCPLERDRERRRRIRGASLGGR